MNGSSVASRVGSIVLALSTMLVLVALAIVPFLNPTWLAFEQGRTGVTELTGFSEAEVRTVSTSILDDLLGNAPAFDVELNGVPVLTEPERAHMRDVRGVFGTFFTAAAIAAAFVVGAFWLARRGRAASWSRREAWAGVRAGALGLGAAMIVGGLVALVAFDAAFEVFHRLFFAQGTYLFDPRTSRLVQLFPDAFWTETSIAVGVIALVLAVATTWLAGRRLNAAAPGASERSAATPNPASIVATGASGTAGVSGTAGTSGTAGVSATAADPGRAR